VPPRYTRNKIEREERKRERVKERERERERDREHWAKRVGEAVAGK